MYRQYRYLTKEFFCEFFKFYEILFSLLFFTLSRSKNFISIIYSTFCAEKVFYFKLQQFLSLWFV